VGNQRHTGHRIAQTGDQLVDACRQATGPPRRAWHWRLDSAVLAFGPDIPARHTKCGLKAICLIFRSCARYVGGQDLHHLNGVGSGNPGGSWLSAMASCAQGDNAPSEIPAESKPLKIAPAAPHHPAQWLFESSRLFQQDSRLSEATGDYSPAAYSRYFGRAVPCTASCNVRTTSGFVGVVLTAKHELEQAACWIPCGGSGFPWQQWTAGLQIAERRCA